MDKIYLQQEKGINVWGMYDSGSVIQNIMLLAVNYGLGTIAQAMAVVYPDVIRKELDIPQNKLIALGVAIGYPDWDNEVNEPPEQSQQYLQELTLPHTVADWM